jgi:hypothetical protein
LVRNKIRRILRFWWKSGACFATPDFPFLPPANPTAAENASHFLRGSAWHCLRQSGRFSRFLPRRFTGASSSFFIS